MGGDGKAYYVIFKLETKFLCQKLRQGNRFATIVRIGDKHKFTNYQNIFMLLTLIMCISCVRKFTTCILSLISDIKYISRVLFMSTYVSGNASF